jgi:transposase
VTLPSFCAIVGVWETLKEYGATLTDSNSGACEQHVYWKKVSVSHRSPAKSVYIANRSVAGHSNWRRKGVRAWNKPVARGGKPRLSARDLERIERALKRGPEAFGYDTGLWTSARVADLIQQECGIAYHPGHVWRLLRQLGWSCQRPTGRALERNQKAIAEWKRKRWPEIKKKPKNKGSSSSSSTKAD